jgi:hypothetical protein
MRELLYHEDNKGGGIKGRGECYSYATIKPPLTPTGQKPEYAQLLDIVLHACTIPYNLDSFGIAGSMHLGVIESALCLQCQRLVWLPRPEITRVVLRFGMFGQYRLVFSGYFTNRYKRKT